MMNRKNIAAYSFAVLFGVMTAILILNFVSGAVVIISPNSSENFTRSIFINVSYVNTTDITDAVNLTVYFSTNNSAFTSNARGNWSAFPFGNASPAVGSCTLGSCWVNITINKTFDGDYSINVSIFNRSQANAAGTTQVNASVGPVFVRLDHTSPEIFNVNITSNARANLTSSNHSELSLAGTLTLNVSIVDAVFKEPNLYVFFNVTNSTGNQNGTFIATREGSTSSWSVQINSTNFKDGIYNITAFVNDTLGNLNNTARHHTVIFDNTQPSASLSCSPTTVNSGDTITCTCSASDATSGVKTTSNKNSGKPPTSSSGTGTTDCTVTDYAGNSFTATASYTVEQGGGGSGGSSGGSGGSGSGGTSSTPSKTTTKILGTLYPGDDNKVQFLDASYGIKEMNIQVKEEADNVQITLKKYDTQPSSVTERNGATYRYLEINATNLVSKMEESSIQFEVETSWLNEKNVAKDNIAVYKFVNGGWSELPTSDGGTIGRGGLTYQIYNVKVNSFSFFAIGEKAKPVEEPAPTEVSTSESAQPQLSPETEESQISSSVVLAVIAIALIIIAAIIWFVVLKKKRK